MSSLPPTERIVCCAKVVWNNPYQLKYVDPFGDGTVIRVNLIAPQVNLSIVVQGAA